MQPTTKTSLFLQILSLGMLPTAAAAQTEIRLATLLPRGSSHYQILEAMGHQWCAASGGTVRLTINADGTMGSEAETVQRIRIGQLQAAPFSSGGLSEIDSSVGALQKIPMVYRSLEEVEYVRSHMEAEIEHKFAAKGLVVLFWADTGWVNIFSRQPALHPAEFRHTKVFVGADDREEAVIVKQLGFPAVPLEWSDVLISLQSGMVDTVDTTPFLALAGQYHLVTKHMLEVPWVMLVGGTVPQPGQLVRN